AEIAQQVGQQANVSAKGEGGAGDSGPATGADGGEAYRDPFDPDFWTRQVQVTSAEEKRNAAPMDADMPLEEEVALAMPQPSQDTALPEMPKPAEEAAKPVDEASDEPVDESADIPEHAQDVAPEAAQEAADDLRHQIEA